MTRKETSEYIKQVNLQFYYGFIVCFHKQKLNMFAGNRELVIFVTAFMLMLALSAGQPCHGCKYRHGSKKNSKRFHNYDTEKDSNGLHDSHFIKQDITGKDIGWDKKKDVSLKERFDRGRF